MAEQRKMNPTGEREREIPEMSFDEFFREYIVEAVHNPLIPLGIIHLVAADGSWMATIRPTFIDEVAGVVSGRVTTPIGRVGVDYLAVSEGRKVAHGRAS